MAATQKKKKKIFILDTNVILHDSTCINQFGECDIVIPISVIEELDSFKKGHDILNYHAREFLRALDGLSNDKIFNGGVPIGPNLGKISIKLDEKFHKDLSLSFPSHKVDHSILNTAYQLFKKSENKKVVLVTKDVNLRMKARAIGLIAEDYTTDHVKDISQLYNGYRFEEDVPIDLIDKMYNDPLGIEAKTLNPKKKLLPNEYIVMQNEKKSAIGYLDPQDNMIKRVEKITASGIKPRNVEQTFALHALLNENIKLITISGKAGTGKTLLALAAALERRDHYGQVFLARPVVPLSNKDLGFLPGDVFQKLSPYMQPLYDNLGVIQNKRIQESNKKPKKLAKTLDEEKLTIAPLAYIRGRSLVDTYFIVDEAQNLTPHEVKTIITRAGENTKMVFTGDIFQIDHPYLDIYSNGLSYLIEKMQGQKIYTHINLEKGERSELAEIASNIL
ncbi:MAG TPA: PhoH family protein [Candidatus Omnitrophota bacterium]|nr:PhoH family protein [Candidatus Omnitrophota bacterium]HPN87992.1 PhoH family protein [Candidatus Omnitrophota bacterium]